MSMPAAQRSGAVALGQAAVREMKRGMALLAVLLSGCASLNQTLIDPPAVDNLVYIGTRSDWQYLSAQCDPPVERDTCHYMVALAWPFVLADLPLTMVSDTVLLPYTLAKSR